MMPACHLAAVVVAAVTVATGQSPTPAQAPPPQSPVQSPPVQSPTPEPTQPSAQAAPPADAPPAAVREQHFIQLRYPRDKQYVVALVDGLPIWLEHLVQHIDERHFPGFHQLMAGADGNGSADGKRILESDLIAPWVRQLADIRALEKFARDRGEIEQERLDQVMSDALKHGFEQHLEAYVQDLQRRGLPTKLGQSRIDNLLTDYQLRFGLRCELQGWLDYLSPERDWTDQQLNDFFQDHPRYFGGGVNIAQILVQNRDAGTGILLREAGRIRAAARLSEVQGSLLPDGSNFADIARRFSDDTRGGRDGGVLDYVERFDQRLPAALCRAAWSMADGQISDVIETQYGWHIVRRIEHVQRVFMLYSQETRPAVHRLMHRELQENLLFGARKEHRIELKL